MIRYKSRHRHIDLVKLDTLCPNLKELTVSDSIMVYKPGNSMVVDIKSFSNLKYLTVKDIIMEGDQACWKRLASTIPDDYVPTHICSRSKDVQALCA